MSAVIQPASTDKLAMYRDKAHQELDKFIDRLSCRRTSLTRRCRYARGLMSFYLARSCSRQKNCSRAKFKVYPA